MPICKREGFEDFSKNPKEHTFQDNEEVFYCETTRQIFRDYEEYFRHVMVINSTIWQCEATKRENLTYAEALKSERRARKKLEQFKDCLRPVVMLLIEKAQQASLRTLSHLAYNFIRSRYFVNEDVEAQNNSSTHLKYIVVAVLPKSKSKSPPDGDIYDPATIQYKLKKVGGQFHGKEYLIPHESIRRPKIQFCHDNLKSFISQNVIRIDGILRPKPESYKKYVTDREMTFAKMHIGKMPNYEPSRPRKIVGDGEKKQSSMANYLTKIETDKAKAIAKAEEEAAREERIKTMRDEMERIRKLKEEKHAEQERKKAERNAKIEKEASAIAKKTDDLNRYDQKPLPEFRTITTQIPLKYFGDCIMVHEFMHSFRNILTGINVFKNKITFYELTRAFTFREVVGPLSDIILVLLGTIFELQQDEEAECAVEYTRVKNKEREPYATMALAFKTHEFARRNYSVKMNELPLDANSLSEVLRLHFLGSGAQVIERAERWRVMYRNGYYSTEDPGLAFRMQQPHILRALKMYSVYQLPTMDIFRIIHTLIAQILTYSSTINLIEERADQTIKARMELRTLMSTENRRVINVEGARKKLVADFAAMAKEQPTESKPLEEKLNKKVAELLAISSRDKKKYEIQLEKLHTSLFDYMVCLGTDRAYRKYYVLESIAGVFVEHPPECYDTCLNDPPQNAPHLVGCPRAIKEIRMFLAKLYTPEDELKKRKRKSQPSAGEFNNKENKENQAITNGGVVLNGDAIKMEEDGEILAAEPVLPVVPPTQYQLMMCTGDPTNCIVHDEKNPDRQRWAFFHTEEELDALINTLNPLGERESSLREQLSTMRALIARHIKTCPVNMLTLEDNVASKRFEDQLKEETRKKYQAANFGFENNADLNEVMYAMLVDRILQMEMDITNGDLGNIKIKNLEKWREDIQKNTYDPQETLTWGQVHPYAKTYKDPGLNLGDTIDIESEDSADEGISLHDSSILRQCVKNLSSALLQIEQGIEQRFLAEPFGAKKETKDKEKMENMLERGRENLRYWERSLMHSTSYSQVFLHLNILYRAIKWQRSTSNSCCQICHRVTDPEKMLLCDECNAGTHMFCMKPKMLTVPEGNWYCRQCVSRLGLKNEKKTKKRAFLLDEEDNASETSSRSNSRRHSKRLKPEDIEEEMCKDDEGVDEEELNGEEEDAEAEAEETIEGDIAEEEDAGDEEEEPEAAQGIPVTADDDENAVEDDDEEICVVCSYNGGEIACTGCKAVYHLDCVDLKKPPRSNWNCNNCKELQNKKRKSKQNEDSTDDELYDQPQPKRTRPSGSGKRSSMRNSMNDSFGGYGSDEVIRTNNNNRRARRAADNLPLNSPVLYDLLDDIMRHGSSWPFLRPVSHSEVPDYHSIIKDPMDFAKVKSKLNMGKYTINEELLKDIELVFKNCDIYNQEGNEIYEAGSSLERFVMIRCKELQLPFQPSDMNRL